MSRRSMPRTATRPGRALLGAAAAALIASVAWVGLDPSRSSAQEDGVYEAELPSFVDGFVPAASGVPALIGAATPTGAAGDPISSVADFRERFSAPSPALAAAVEDFYAAGGGPAFVLATSAEDPATLAAAVGTAGDQIGWDLLVVPALATLAPADWTALATQMARVADGEQGVALLDPPAAAVLSAATDGGAALVAAADSLRSTEWSTAAVMYSSGLLEADGTAVATAPSGAGVLAASDQANGPWEVSGGSAYPLVGSTPALLVDNPLSATLNEAHITMVRVVPGFGTVFMGDRNLSDSLELGEVSTVRTADLIERSITAGLQQYVFGANDGDTWSQVVASTSEFLDGLWQAGGIAGASPSEAYTVNAGLGSTMTAQDVLDGILLVDVTVSLGDPARPIELSFSQPMQG